MYLSDRDLRAKLTEMDVVAEDGSDPFDAKAQIQPASIDLRLSKVFWTIVSRRTLDLRSQTREVSPRRDWRMKVLNPGESLTLRPGEMLLGRTNEEFSVPPELAGKIEGRSSFARLGLMVHCAGDFINPGWRGRMPLELVNLSSRSIRLVPGLAICQVMLVRLSSLPERTYKEGESSKYLNDDGGPSYWWRDAVFAKLMASLRAGDLSQRLIDELAPILAKQHPDIATRFEEFVNKRRVGEVTNSRDLLAEFSKQEDARRMTRAILRNVGIGALPLLLAASIERVFADPFGPLHYSLWALTALWMVVSLIAFRWRIGEHLGADELNRLGH